MIPLRQRTDLSNYTILLKINCVADLINSLYNCLLFIVSRIFWFKLLERLGPPRLQQEDASSGLPVYVINGALKFLPLVLCRQYTVSNLVLFLIYSVALIPNLTSAVFYSVLVDKYSHTVVEAVRNRSSDCLTEAEWITSYSGYSISDPVGILNALLTRRV